ncbi:hypothetical protein CBR_g34398 [Chara braunii]|uniref:Uncharacterized protein n=1 Tax=Chara braunii TaxID=69332 RepID=A0A388LIL5_CHABU|nr:hypothetical protein CBR_g34398 [Chara braunii]|eukprot:GBG82117.1 hypothetical protein CBR_g34398 [Chara braunii]
MKPSIAIGVLVAVGLVLLLASPLEVSGHHYACWYNTDQNAHTYKKIDCKKKPAAASVEGCQEICDSQSKCRGIVYADYNWPSHKYCCFLKSTIDEDAFKDQQDRETCRKAFN